MTMTANFTLTFKPQAEQPTESGACVIYNQCDGFHVVESIFYDGEFRGFKTWAARDYIDDDFYQAWAMLPDSESLYDLFADKPVGDKSARDVTLERLAQQAVADTRQAGAPESLESATIGWLAWCDRRGMAGIAAHIERMRAALAAPVHPAGAVSPAEPYALAWFYPDGRPYTLTWFGEDAKRIQGGGIKFTSEPLYRAALPAPSSMARTSVPSGSDGAGGLHSQIMNLPCERATLDWANTREAYLYGHRDARHAAAELVLGDTAERVGQGTGAADGVASKNA